MPEISRRAFGGLVGGGAVTPVAGTAATAEAATPERPFEATPATATGRRPNFLSDNGDERYSYDWPPAARGSCCWRAASGCRRCCVSPPGSTGVRSATSRFSPPTGRRPSWNWAAPGRRRRTRWTPRVGRATCCAARTCPSASCSGGSGPTGRSGGAAGSTTGTPRGGPPVQPGRRLPRTGRPRPRRTGAAHRTEDRVGERRGRSAAVSGRLGPPLEEDRERRPVTSMTGVDDLCGVCRESRRSPRAHIGRHARTDVRRSVDVRLRPL